MVMPMGQQPPMGPPPMLPTMDPEAILQMAEAVQAEMERQAELMMQPQFPPWYRERDYPKPDPDKAYVKARQLETEFAPLRRRIHDEFVTVDPSSPYAGHYDDYDSDEDDQWFDTAISGEIELIAYQLADSQLSFDAPAKTVELRDEAAKKVDFALSCMDNARDLHARMGNGSLAIEKAKTLLTSGRLAWHCMLNLDADEDEMPFHEELVDPASCYPVYEGKRGLKLMVRVYHSTVGEAVGHFDDAKGTLSKQFVHDHMAERGKDGQLPEEAACEVIEYWDRRWRVVFINNIMAGKPVEHRYGFVPFVYKLGPLGMPGYMRLPENDVTIGVADYHRVYGRDLSMPHKGIGLPTLLKLPKLQREAVYTRLNRAFKASMEPPLLTYMDDMTYPDGTPEVSLTPGDNSPMKKDRQVVEAVPINPNANVLLPILQGQADNLSRLTQPPTAHGLNDKSNVSGYATQGLNEAGRIKLVPWLRTLEEFEAQCMEMRFRMFRDWGYLIRQGEGEYGLLSVPRHEAGPDEDQAFELSPGDLKRAGLGITVSMSSLPLQMLGPVANAIGILMQLGIEDEIGAMKKLNVQNPYKVLQRIQTNKVLNDPAMIEADVLEALAEQGAHGKVAYIVARKMGEKQMQAMGGGMGQGPPGAMGESQAAMGRPPGPGSGPQGPVNAPTSPLGTEP